MRSVMAAAVLLVFASLAAAEEDGVIDSILRAKPEWFAAVHAEADRHRLQILYTQIDRDEDNRPTFTPHGFRLDAKRYFYPASTVKLPAAVLALEKLRGLAVPGVDRDTTFRIGKDEATAGTTVGRSIREIFVVSDNDAFNRLYELLGQQYLNEALWRHGFSDVRILRRLESGTSPEENRVTGPVAFLAGDRLLYRQPRVQNPHEWRIDLDDVRQGLGFYRDGELVREPMDFSHSNYLSIESLQGILRAVLFPDDVSPEQRFDLAPDDLAFLRRSMSMLPRESDDPRYDPAEYWDSYGKFFLFGDSKEPIPPNIRIFNKVGQAYGYLLDNAYVADFENGVEFLLTAVIQVNENRIYNDERYEYDAVGLPFLANLGRAIYTHELSRPRANKPDLSRFR